MGPGIAAPLAENWLGVPRYLVGVTLFVAAALTDYFDGKLARSRGVVHWTDPGVASGLASSPARFRRLIPCPALPGG